MKIAIAVLAALFATTSAAPEAARVTTLPTFPADFPSNTYSGYLSLADGHGTSNKNLHYVFVESQNDPANDPLMLWFNGGPGCSSMLAFLQEHGPITLDDYAPAFVTNEFSWNKKLNIIYLESPAGVGFSTANENEKVFNDFIQADDAFNALKKWYEAFPEYGPDQGNNDLYIAGESYGGIYAPYLTWKLYESNMNAKTQGGTKYNIKGVVVGNGATDWDVDVWPSFPEVAKSFNLISQKQYDDYRNKGCEFYFNELRPHDGPAECSDLFNGLTDMTAGLSFYDFYRKDKPISLSADDPERYGTVMIDGVEKKYKRGFTPSEYTPWLKHTNLLRQSGAAEPVQAMNLTDWLNKEEVKTALHVESFTEPWETCNGAIGEKWQYQQEGSIWIYRILEHTDLRMLFFSGDTDGAVTTLGTRRWMRKLGWDITEKWRPWYTGGQVSGYVEKYKGDLDFVTVKGVGHMAPQWAKPQVQSMIFDWISNTDLPKQ